MAQIAHGLDRGDPGTSPVRVLVVDDNEGFRESLVALLATDELVVVGEADSGEQALDVAPGLSPDVVVMDVRMPRMDGVEATRRMKELLPEVGIVALTGNEGQDVVRDMLVAGASGFVLKDSDGDEILQAVLQAAHGGALLSPEITPGVIDELTEALERERRRSRELEEAHRALTERSVRRHEQVARLGHELRTPVTVILGMAQTLAADSATSAQREELLDRLVSRAGDLARLVERFELAVDAAFTEHVDVPEIAHSAASIDADRVHVHVTRSIPSANLNPVVGRRLLEELVENALRFSQPPARVDILVERGPGGAEVRVVDRGNGIADEDRERIFGALEQAEELNARTHQGVGMGLSLARTAARAADGDVVLESTGPDGSTFLWLVGPPA
ncbi:MAG: response regulator [Actinomycetota bacterium]